MGQSFWERTLGGVGDVLGGAGSMVSGIGDATDNDTAQLVGNLMQLGGNAMSGGSHVAADEFDGMGLLGDVVGAAGDVAGLTGASGIGTYLGGVGSGLGLISNANTALDEDESFMDRVVAGTGAVGNYLSLAGNGMLMEATGSAFSLSTMGGESALAALSGGTLAESGAIAAGAGAGTAAASAAAVIAAGIGGWKVGEALDAGAGWLGDQIADDGQDHTLSGSAARMTAGIDRWQTGLRRDWGMVDEDRPEYTQTLGWQIADGLESMGINPSTWYD